MSHRKLWILVAFVLILSAALFVRVEGYQVTGIDAERAAALPYGMRGPYPVGIRELEIDGETPLEITVWYPALENDGGVTFTYPYKMKLPAPLGTVSVASFEGQAIMDAPYNPGPYPLVILSPGFAISSTTYGWLAEHLASHGFVVISPDHQESLNPETDLWQATVTRPQDILTVFAYIDEQVETGGVFDGLIDQDRAAVIGHSYGGYTAQAAAGARLNPDGFKALCEAAYEADDPNIWLCDVLLPHIDDMAELADLDPGAEGLWPVWADPRVDAIVSMAGDAYLFNEAGLAEITIPVMAIGGTADTDTPYMWGPHMTYKYVSSPKKVKIALTDAEHMIFTGPCESVPLILKPISGEFCSDPGWDREYAHYLVNHFTTAFLLAELKQDTAAAKILAPQAVDFPDLSYEAEGY